MANICSRGLDRERMLFRIPQEQIEALPRESRQVLSHYRIYSKVRAVTSSLFGTYLRHVCT